MPVSPNAWKVSRFWYEGVLSRPRRTSPKLPITLTVERRSNLKPEPPSSTFRPPSSQKPAFRPFPRSSTPRKPRRLLELPPLARPDTLLPVVEMRATETSATPKRVTLELWAEAPAAVASAARARRVRFMVFNCGYVNGKSPRAACITRTTCETLVKTRSTAPHWRKNHNRADSPAGHAARGVV